MRHIIPVSGKDSAATAVVQMARRPDLPYEFLFCDVRMELPETYAWIDRLESHLGVTIVRVGRSLEDIIAGENMLPSHGKRSATAWKIFPIRDYLAGDEAIPVPRHQGGRGRPRGGHAVTQYHGQLPPHRPRPLPPARLPGPRRPGHHAARFLLGASVRHGSGATAPLPGRGGPPAAVGPVGAVRVAVAVELLQLLLPEAVRVGRAAGTPPRPVRAGRANRARLRQGRQTPVRGGVLLDQGSAAAGTSESSGDSLDLA